MNKSKLLLIGYCPPPVGGVTVLFKQLVDDLLKHDDIELKTINLSTTDKSLINKIKLFIKTIFLVTRNIVNSDIISLHATKVSAFTLGPIIYLISKLFDKKIIFRKFGGTFHRGYEEKNIFLRWLLSKTILKSDICLFETKELVNYFEDVCANEVKWYPNSRKIHKKNNLSNHARKFVFISQMKESKGVQQIFKASKQLPKDIIIDLYGPLGYDISKDEIQNLNNSYSANYEGALNPSEVIDVLNKYDILLLPTYHKGEGYPGIILEAYSCGLPVITTKWNSIPEIVNEECGVLIEPKNKQDLVKAILKINKKQKYFKRLQRGTLKQAELFNSYKWSNEFYDLCKKL